MPPPKVRPSQKPRAPAGMTADQRAATKAAAGVSLAEKHIDAIYQEKKLYAYGCGMVIGYVNDEFDDFMNLSREKPKEADGLFSTLFSAALDIVGAIPPLSVGIKVGKTAGAIANAIKTTVEHSQAGYERATSVVEAIVRIEGVVKEPSESTPADKGQEEMLRNAAVKFPLVQKAISAAYLVEYERQAAQRAFLETLVAKMDDPSFTGTPQTLAAETFGPAPPNLTPEAIYKQFAAVKDAIFKEIMKLYVRRYVILVKSIFTNADAGTSNSFWGLYKGLNEAQWAELYRRFGTRVPIEQRNALIEQKIRAKASRFRALLPLYFLKVAEDPEPVLTELSDLVSLWDARRVVFHTTTDLHGLRTRTDFQTTPR